MQTEESVRVRVSTAMATPRTVTTRLRVSRTCQGDILNLLCEEQLGD